MTAVVETVIYLTNRRPVRFVESEWPIIASLEEYNSGNANSATRIWQIFVRRNADGRCIVNGINTPFTTTTQAMVSHHLAETAGEIVANIDAVANHINVVGGKLKFSPLFCQKAINALPPEDLVSQRHVVRRALGKWCQDQVEGPHPDFLL